VQNAPCAFLVEIDIAELDMDWIHPWIGLGQKFCPLHSFFPKTERLRLVFSFAKMHFFKPTIGPQLFDFVVPTTFQLLEARAELVISFGQLFAVTFFVM